MRRVVLPPDKAFFHLLLSSTTTTASCLEILPTVWYYFLYSITVRTEEEERMHSFLPL